MDKIALLSSFFSGKSLPSVTCHDLKHMDLDTKTIVVNGVHHSNTQGLPFQFNDTYFVRSVRVPGEIVYDNDEVVVGCVLKVEYERQPVTRGRWIHRMTILHMSDAEAQRWLLAKAGLEQHSTCSV